uniref:NADH-ubiquinone oxidoreductase chain 6 n=1 Tax=Lycodon semicarinatus TaxID=56549 RepID=NU6M_LYCSM|nr:NADH dehydrogenase subunit 6 [Lycodon semicarinatus]O79557.1 RecName: Full=NADH-ubiquinone oxidoreductase chain 6; AltName: Full=NADH dehydrogenase subunit 6 [Lycodon semicarinatus]BAA33033.1 NADH dehydrogenase subunit 6 [Lycodon semicarinatus]
MNYFFSLVLVFLVLSVVVLGVVSAPYQGVVALMGVSFFCCIFMVFLGRTFAALVMYIVYLGGLVVVFGYCVSVEKESGIYSVGGTKYFIVCVSLLLVVLLCLLREVGGLLVYVNWGDLVCLEMNGVGVFYFSGGWGLIVCSWGLLVVLFSILVILSWSRLGGLRPF